MKRLAFCSGVTICLLSACDGWSNDEVVRLTSPNNKFDAVLIESNGGATTSFAYDIHIVKHNTPTGSSRVAYFYGAVRNQNAYGINLHWKSSNQLVAEYLNARIEVLEKPLTKIDGQEIKVVLRPGINDPTAPPGGMYRNLKKQQ